jgi:hypothetical protein
MASGAIDKSGVAGGVNVGKGVAEESKAVAVGSRPGGAVSLMMVGVGNDTASGWRIKKTPTRTAAMTMPIRVANTPNPNHNQGTFWRSSFPIAVSLVS